MTHFVPDEGVDSGPVILSRHVPIFTDDTLKELETRVHDSEHMLVIDTVRSLLDGSCGWEGKK